MYSTEISLNENILVHDMNTVTAMVSIAVKKYLPYINGINTISLHFGVNLIALQTNGDDDLYTWMQRKRTTYTKFWPFKIVRTLNRSRRI